jgi:small subunit ribosomal protein S4
MARGKRGGGSDYGAQLLEKQKARFTYGLSESQFSRYAAEAMEQKGDSGLALVSKLESRLDNTVFRAGFVKTRRAARQLVSHGHVQINGRRMNIPSYQVKAGETVSIRPESRQSPLFGNRAEAMLEVKTPTWLEMSADGFAVTLTTVPALTVSEVPFNAAVIIQFYSR